MTCKIQLLEMEVCADQRHWHAEAVSNYIWAQVFQTPSNKTPAFVATPGMDYSKENLEPHSDVQTSRLSHVSPSNADEPTSSE